MYGGRSVFVPCWIGSVSVKKIVEDEGKKDGFQLRCVGKLRRCGRDWNCLVAGIFSWFVFDRFRDSCLVFSFVFDGNI